jgi:bifunctional UDP-N-acetylglucosamine pyrophosphorylase / glucosamine-1-phosphate N-acetyltransferase
MTDPVSVVILAAGLGTRMKSRTAKVLHRAGGLTLIEHVARTAVSVAPPENVVVVVGHQAESVQKTLVPSGIQTALQTEQKGTGHAVACAREQLASQEEGLLVVLYGDCPLLSPETVSRLVAAQSASSNAATVITTTLEDPTGYGRVFRDEEHRYVKAIVEQKAAIPEQAAIREINSGIYCFRSNLLWNYIDRITPHPASGEIYLTDIVELFMNDQLRVQPMHLDDPTEVLGINTRVELAQVDAHFRARKVREMMLAGVTIERPETVTIDLGVEAGMDTIIEPFARITGATVIGEECRIGMGAIVSNCQIGNRVQIAPYTLMDSCRIDDDAHLGPFARLRMQAHVETGAHVGNFVELKKTRLGAGSKSMHLAYLGDSTIGKKVNVGAGTITCNYDGVKKHATHIEDGAFVGSNSTLVAPVSVGAGSYVAAGSVVTEAVPSDALALGRSRQVNKEGWARRRREGGAKS